MSNHAPDQVLQSQDSVWLKPEFITDLSKTTTEPLHAALRIGKGKDVSFKLIKRGHEKEVGN